MSIVAAIDQDNFSEIAPSLGSEDLTLHDVAVSATREYLDTLYYLVQEAGLERKEAVAQVLQAVSLPTLSEAAEEWVGITHRSDILQRLGERIGAASLSLIAAHFDFATIRAAHFAAGVLKSPRVSILARQMEPYAVLLAVLTQIKQAGMGDQWYRDL
jgi:hypothetical protein